MSSSRQAKKLPLLNMLREFRDSEGSSWHMPGHSKTRQWPLFLRQELLALDTTELDKTGDLLEPTGQVQTSLNLAASICGAGWTRYLTCGSTVGILSMLAAYPGRGGRLLVSKVVHQSIINAAALLDLQIGWIKADLWLEVATADNETSIKPLLPQVSLESFRQAAKKFGAYDAVLLTSPDYYGTCAPIQDIAQEAHANGALVLVDEAHGAHLALSLPQLPRSALKQGADICVQSAHKTLPALTSAALLHVNQSAMSTKRVNVNRLATFLNIFHTSSPSFVIAASTEYAVNWLHHEGLPALERTLTYTENLKNRLAGKYYLSTASSFRPTNLVASKKERKIDCLLRDPLHILIEAQLPTLDGLTLYRLLVEQGISVEMHDLKRLILLPALDQNEQEFDLLALALEKIYREHKRGYAAACRQTKTPAITQSSMAEQKWREDLSHLPQSAISIFSALQEKPGSVHSIPIKEAEGCVAAQSIIPYPPGIPLLLPGEILNKNKLELIKILSENKICLKGLERNKINIIKL